MSPESIFNKSNNEKPFHADEVARRAHDHLNAIAGRRAYVIIGASADTTEEVLTDLKDVAEGSGINFIYTATDKGKNILDVFSSFRRMETHNEPEQVLIITDEVLADSEEFCFGRELADSILSRCNVQRWKTPYFVSTPAHHDIDQNIMLVAGANHLGELGEVTKEATKKRISKALHKTP